MLRLRLSASALVAGVCTRRLRIVAAAAMERPFARRNCVAASCSVSPFRSGSGGFHGSVARRFAGTSTSPSSATPSALLWWCGRAGCRAPNVALPDTSLCHRCGADSIVTGDEAAGSASHPCWSCDDCGTINFQMVRFCKSCAAPQRPTRKWRCPGCRTKNEIGAGIAVASAGNTEFACTRCGYNLTTPLSEAQPQATQQPTPTEKAATPPLALGGDAVATSAAPPANADDENAPLPGPPGFDWMCRAPTCGTVNGGDDELCVSCQTKLVPSRWACGACAAENHRTRSKCFDCGAQIALAWTCVHCKKKTSVYERSCRSCKTERPAVVPSGPKVAGGGAGAGGARRGDWVCGQCSQVNFGWRERCYQCDAAAAGSGLGGDGDDGGSASKAKPLGENNWNCRSCLASNFRTRTECWQCGVRAAGGRGAAGAGAGAATTSEESAAVLPTIEKEGFQAPPSGREDVAPGMRKQWVKPATGSLGGRRGGQETADWTCSKCFSRNFKTRKECFKCGAEKMILAMGRQPIRTPIKL